MDVPAHQMGPPLEQLRAVLATDGPGTVQLTGKAVVQQDVNHLSFRDLERAEMVGLPIALIVLCFAFRGLYAALIAVMMGISAVITAMGVTSLLGYHLELSNFIINVIPMVGMALSIDFALIILSRYREEVQRAYEDEGKANVTGSSLDMQSEVLRSEILQRTLRTAGRAVLFSAALRAPWATGSALDQTADVSECLLGSHYCSAPIATVKCYAAASSAITVCGSGIQAKVSPFVTQKLGLA